MPLVDDIVLDQETQRHLLVVSNAAFCVQPVLGNAFNYSFQHLVIGLPSCNQRRPRCLVIAVRCNPALLRIERTGIAAIKRRAYEALMVISG